MFGPDTRPDARSPATAASPPGASSAAARGAPSSRAGPGVESLPALLDVRASASPRETAALHRPGGIWLEVTWSELSSRVADLADGLAALGIAAGDRVAVVSDTGVDGLVADLAILAAGAVCVPIYPSTTAAETRDLLHRAGARLVLCDRDEHARKLETVRSALPGLLGVVRLGDRAGPGERTVLDLERIGRASRGGGPGAHVARTAALRSGDLATILFTSGTTGAPKGVMLSHGNWLWSANQAEALALVRPDDVTLLFLPLAHAFGKLCEYAWLRVGGRLALAGMDRIVEDAAEVRPTYIPGPPRVFEKVFAGVVAAGSAAPGLEGWVFRAAMRGFDAWAAAEERGLRHRGGPGLALARRVVLPKVAAKVKARLGGRVRLMLSGSAPLSPVISRFFEAIGLPVLQGYGMTETSAAISVTRPENLRHGTVGPPLGGTELRIAEDGEVLVRSPGVTRGYWQDPDATAEALEDGWLHTGDVGVVEADGSLRLTDRKKDLIATAGGKKVAPQLLERELKSDVLISHVVVHGDRRPYVVALVTLDEAAVRRWASERGIELRDELGATPALRDRIQATVSRVNAELPRFATIKRFAILPRDLSVAEGELTPTLKVRRKACEARYAAALDALYV